MPLGRHEFVFQVNDSFFANFENSEIRKGDFKVEVGLQKQAIMLVMTFKIKGKAMVECDRCGDECELKIEGEQSLIVKLDGGVEEEGDEIVMLSSSASELEISPFIYEFIILSLPLKRMHTGKKGKNACNAEVIRKLEEIAVHTEKQEDPRWNDLKNIKLS